MGGGVLPQVLSSAATGLLNVGLFSEGAVRGEELTSQRGRPTFDPRAAQGLTRRLERLTVSLEAFLSLQLCTSVAPRQL